MATEAADRFATATDFARALDEVAVRVASAELKAEPGDTVPSVSPTSPRPQSSRRLTRTVSLAALAMAAVATAMWGVSQRGSRASTAGASADPSRIDPSEPPSIAVLYLMNRSADTLDAYLADGITEEITSRLGRLGRLRVKSRGAVARLRSAGTTDPSEAGRSLGVEYVVVGNLRRVGDSVRTSVQLVRTGDGSEAWTADYAVPRDQLVAIQDSIVVHVSRIAGGGVAVDGQAVRAARRSLNPEAHDHYLRGNFQLAKRTPVSVARAIEEFRAASRIDPAMTSARAREGYAYAVFADWGWAHPDGLTSEQLLERGLAAADHALGQDSASAEGWLARAYLLFLRHPRTLEGVVAAFERAVALDSTNAEAQYQYGQALMVSGLAGPAVARYQRAIALEPDWASPLMSLGALVARSGRYDEGLRWLDSAVAVDPSSSYSFSARSTTWSARRTCSAQASRCASRSSRSVPIR